MIALRYVTRHFSCARLAAFVWQHGQTYLVVRYCTVLQAAWRTCSHGSHGKIRGESTCTASEPFSTSSWGLEDLGSLM